VSAVPRTAKTAPQTAPAVCTGVSVSFSVLAERELLCPKGGIDPAAFFVFYRLIKVKLKRAPLGALIARTPVRAWRGVRASA
ncbi:MAG: hypothetical protein MPL62_04000, partial [Alphaproteobacteria bacterium]|nr:hypothetical protein [Alphaproteobacteria bacterium]